jgi:hypothetical protein
MIMLEGNVMMAMGVLSEHGRLVSVVVMTVVVTMRVLVLDLEVAMHVTVPLRKVQPDSDEEPQSTDGRQWTRRTIAREPRHRSAEERSHGEDRSRSRSADATLRGEVQAQRHAVSGRSACH